MIGFLVGSLRRMRSNKMACVCREGVGQCSWWFTRDFNSQIKSYCANANVPIQAKIICDGNQPQFFSKWGAGIMEVLIQGDDVTLEKQRKSPMLDILEGPVIIDQKDTSALGAQKQYTQTNTISMSEISSQKNITLVVEPKELSKADTAQGQTVVNYRNTPMPKNQTATHQTNALRVLEIIDPKIPSTNARQKESLKSDIIKELETNLEIATVHWSDKPLPFQTASWDTKHGDDEPLLTSHVQELIQLYVDVGLANNIVWLAIEIGHRSRELDESYIKLCANIGERINNIMESAGGTV
jgi:hypothetical protein